MNTGIGDAFDLSWKLAAVLKGFGSPGLIASYENEHPVGLRNREASAGHNAVRVKIAALYNDDLMACTENESRGIEFGYVYADSPILARENVEISNSSQSTIRPLPPARACQAHSCQTAQHCMICSATGSPCWSLATPIRPRWPMPPGPAACP